MVNSPTVENILAQAQAVRLLMILLNDLRKSKMESYNDCSLT